MVSSLVTTSGPTCIRVTMLLDLHAMGAGVSVPRVSATASVKRHRVYFYVFPCEGIPIRVMCVSENAEKKTRF